MRRLVYRVASAAARLRHSASSRQRSQNLLKTFHKLVRNPSSSRRWRAAGAGAAALAGAGAAHAALASSDEEPFFLKKTGKRDSFQANRIDFFRPISAAYGFVYDKLYPPETKKLLPQALPDEWGGMQRTLVLNLEGTLVHSEYKNESFKVTLRPFAKTLLSDAINLGYEIVLFSDDNLQKVEVLVQLLDPKQQILHRLSEEHCTYTKGRYVKDLSRLNRELKNCILVDFKPDSWAKQPANAMSVRKFTGKKDVDLVEVCCLIELLNSGNEPVEDVRPVLRRLQSGETLVDIFGEEGRAVVNKKMREYRKEQMGLKQSRLLGFGSVASRLRQDRVKFYGAPVIPDGARGQSQGPMGGMDDIGGRASRKKKAEEP